MNHPTPTDGERQSVYVHFGDETQTYTYFSLHILYLVYIFSS